MTVEQDFMESIERMRDDYADDLSQVDPDDLGPVERLGYEEKQDQLRKMNELLQAFGVTEQ